MAAVRWIASSLRSSQRRKGAVIARSASDEALVIARSEATRQSMAAVRWIASLPAAPRKDEERRHCEERKRRSARHCEERSDAAIHGRRQMDCFVATLLAKTKGAVIARSASDEATQNHDVSPARASCTHACLDCFAPLAMTAVIARSASDAAIQGRRQVDCFVA